ncbi:peroxiredoxin [Candidatus Ichthyocystis hellenicum]|uniref:peroxiredoxin n=1 Tax=Candidatus Ichthyocystis hellenicum TaxID=1561003 RepID=UPI000AACD218|nr:redoxin domain-containing protein [Candidatus Ichthyocystis hellenicum]
MSVLVGCYAPDFTSDAVLGNGEIVDGYNFYKEVSGRYALLFFYPLDFTFVCPSELIAVDNRMGKFKELGVEVVGVSIDSKFTHAAWRNKDRNDGGIGHVKFTLVSDLKHDISRAYGVESPSGVSYRGAFLIDRSGIVQSQIVNNLPLGRNFDEVIRLFEAIQFHEQHGDVCPAGWSKGQKGMSPTSDGVSSYLKENSSNL